MRFASGPVTWLRTVVVVAVVGVAACAEDASSQTGALSSSVCRPTGAHTLPDEVRESSGLALSRVRPNILWTHNDRGNEPEIFALATDGGLVQTVRVAAPATDWEDLAVAPCRGGACLLIADIGDNDGDRKEIAIHRIPEPGADARETAPAETLRARFPDGARDAEALFSLPSGDLFIVTKGRGTEIALYRFRAPQDAGRVTELERVRELFPRPEGNRDRVTAAAATPDGRRVGIRTYRRLYLYDTESLVSGGELTPTVVDLAPLQEDQGEGLALADDGTVWLTSEAENRRGRAALNGLRCSFGSSIAAEPAPRRVHVIDG